MKLLTRLNIMKRRMNQTMANIKLYELLLRDIPDVMVKRTGSGDQFISNSIAPFCNQFKIVYGGYIDISIQPYLYMHDTNIYLATPIFIGNLYDGGAAIAARASWKSTLANKGLTTEFIESIELYLKSRYAIGLLDEENYN